MPSGETTISFRFTDFCVGIVNREFSSLSQMDICTKSPVAITAFVGPRCREIQPSLYSKPVRGHLAMTGSNDLSTVYTASSPSETSLVASISDCKAAPRGSEHAAKNPNKISRLTGIGRGRTLKSLYRHAISGRNFISGNFQQKILA